MLVNIRATENYSGPTDSQSNGRTVEMDGCINGSECLTNKARPRRCPVFAGGRPSMRDMKIFIYFVIE